MLLKENTKGGQSKYLTDVEISINESSIVFCFDAKNSSLESFSNKYNDDLWKSNVVEVFIDVGRENKYWEIEVAPNGTIFLAEVTRINGKNTLNMIDECFVEANVALLNDSYKTTITIPLDKIFFEKEKGVRFNAFRIEMEKDKQYLMSLFPTMCETFHKPESFKVLKGK